MTLENGKILTPYGVFSGVSSASFYPGGRIKDLRLDEKNALITHAGELIPQYGANSLRRKYKPSVSFYQNGMVRSVSLEEQQAVQTPIGELPAELLTFYSTGELKRVFPLDGKLSGFWSEEDERGLNIPFRFAFDFTSFSAMLTGVCFYKSGNIKSVTLYPGEQITIRPEGAEIPVRTGFSLYEDGKLQSLEPAAPVKINTPAGVLAAYDRLSDGVNADHNSLSFDEQGRITGVTTEDSISVTKDGETRLFAPAEIRGEDDEEAMLVPLKVVFRYGVNTAVIRDAYGAEHSFGFGESFVIFPGIAGGGPPDCGGCASCSG